MKPFLYSFSFCFMRYEVGMLNPFYIVLVSYVTRWVCATLLIYFCYCFICYDMGMLNPLYIF